MVQALKFADGPLDGQLFMMPGAPPPVLYVRRTVSTEGVLFVPATREAPELLRAGLYRKASAPNRAGQFEYRFDR